MKQKKLSTRILSLILTLALLCTMLPAAVFSAEVSEGLANVYVDGAEWNQVLHGDDFYNGHDDFEGKIPQEPVKSFSKAMDLVAPGGTIWCISTNSVSDTQTWDLTNKPGVTVKWYQDTDGVMVAVDGSGVLTLKNVVIDGTFRDASGTPDPAKLSVSALVNVQGSGHLIMDTGSVIENNNTRHQASAGAWVKDTAQLTMQGNAVIRNNHTSNGLGGGILVDTGATLTIKDNAAITGNSVRGSAGGDGGGIWVKGTINMSGGTVSANNAEDRGGGIFLKNTATANFTGGSVSGNAATGKYNTGAGVDIYSDGCQTWTISGDWQASEGIHLNETATLMISSALKHPITLERIRKKAGSIIGDVVAKGAGSYTLTTDDLEKFSCKTPLVGFALDEANNQIKLAKGAYTGTQATAPVADSKTETSITLKTQTVAGETVQYGKFNSTTGEIDWQDNDPVFDGLSAGTDYYFYTRIKETAGHKEGPTSAGVMIKTAVSTADIDGTVTNKNGAIVGATVRIMNGTTQLASTTTDASGTYSFSALPYGTYSLVAEKDTIKVTKVIDIKAATTKVDVSLPTGNSNTIVETKPETPPTAADGLNELFDPTNVATENAKGVTQPDLDKITGGGSVTITLTAESKRAADVQADVEKIEAVAPGKALTLLDLQVNKVVAPYGGTAGNPVTMTELPTVIEIVIEIPENMRTATDISVYRVHGTDAAQKLPDSGNAGDEYAERKGNYIHIFTKKFSTYALSYTASSVSITSEGATGVSGAGSYAEGTQVTINAGTKSGYTFDKWEVTAGGVTLADAASANTTFIMPAVNVELKATWTYNGSSSTGGGGTTTYPNTVNKPENGTVSISPQSPSKGQTVTITTKPDAGYVVDTVIVKDANGKTIAVTEKGENSYTFVQPGSKATVEVTYKKTGTSGEKSFTDVNANDWFYDAVMAVTANGWFSGTSDTAFGPNAPTNRGMIATILHRMESTPGAAAASFADVVSDAYYADGVAWAQEHGIVTGYSNGNYGPNDNITREQLAAILYRYAVYKGYDVSKTAALGSFADASGVSGYAKDAMSWAVGSGLISGRGNNTLAPTATATRAEVAVILVRFEELFAK